MIKIISDKEKILQFLELKGVSKNSFYKKTGLSVGFLDSGKSLGVDKLRIIIDNYPDFDPMLLLTDGKPYSINASYSRVHEASAEYQQPILEIHPEAKANTFIADIAASAGFGSLLRNNPQGIEQLPAMSLPNAPFGLNVAFQIQGDSMHPTIRHSDFVAGNQIFEMSDIRDGYTYIIIDKDDGPLCKRLYNEGTSFKIVSDNPSYPPYLRSKDSILGYFKCFMRLSTDFRSYHDDVRNSIQDLRNEVQEIKKRLK